MYSWLLVLVVLMAGGGSGGKRRRSSAQQGLEPQLEEEGSEYNPGDDSGHESPDDEVESVRVETRSKKKEQAKEKGKGKERGKGKGKEPATEPEQQTFVRSRRRTGGISFYEPSEVPPPQDVLAPIDPKRARIYSAKQCVGERYVGVDNLFRTVLGFQALYEAGNLREICDFPETTGFGVELIQEFYMRGGSLLESDGGPYQFTTAVRGVDMFITPDIIGHVLEMPAYTGGVDYQNAGLDAVQDWRRVLTALCVEGAKNNGVAILSKDLKVEYRFLNFVLCYNIMPLANTKVIRWDRVLYMYLLGRLDIILEKDLNVNIPFLIWKRMAKELKTANQKDRLPYSLLIMQILRFHNVDIMCTSYEHSLGPIGDTTILKSRVQLLGLQPAQAERPPRAERRVPSPAAGSGSEASISSVYREQQRLSGEIARLTEENVKLQKKVGRMSRILRILCSKMGCGASELPPADSDSE